MSRDDAHLEQAIALAVANVAQGGGPFGAVLVAPDGRTFTGTNRVTRTPDPTAHAEITAFRAAAAGLGTHDLTGCTLYASTQPCPMCLGAALWARVDRVVYASSAEDAAAAGFDDAEFYRQIRSERITAFAYEHRAIPGCTRPFEAWADAAGSRTDY